MKTACARPSWPRRIPSSGVTSRTPRSLPSRRPSPANPGRYMTMLRATCRGAFVTAPILYPRLCTREAAAAAEPVRPLPFRTSTTVFDRQATAYKVGELKFKELRAKAKDRLGDRFDLRRFHNALIDNGALPLGVLEQVIDEWIAAELARSPR